MTPCGTNDVVGDTGGNDNSSPGDKAAPFGERGLEAGQGIAGGFIHNDCPNGNNADGYTIAGNQITLCMRVTEPGDWMRVITDPTPPSDDCEDGKPKILMFRYTGESCLASNNTQTGDTCAGTLSGETIEVSIEYTEKFGNKITVSPTMVFPGESFTVEATGRKTLHSNTAFDIRSTADGSLLQSVRLHTSCSQDLNVGDQFGSLILTGFTAAPSGKPNK